jgi:hypothetical protein
VQGILKHPTRSTKVFKLSLHEFNEILDTDYCFQHIFCSVKAIHITNGKVAVLFIAPCVLVEVYRGFIGACCVHYEGDEY